MKTMEDLVTDSGILTASDAIGSGFSKDKFYRFVKQNDMEQVAHGIYAAEDAFVDELYVLHHRCPGAVFSHEEALFYHGLTDREPVVHTLTVYSGYNTKRLTDSGCKVYSVKKSLLDFGKITVTDQFGNQIPMYDMERTICDIVRSRHSIEIQDFTSAIKSYARRIDKDLNKLMQYAKQFHVDKILKNYMEVLL